jgi:hypothetical protein
MTKRRKQTPAPANASAASVVPAPVSRRETDILAGASALILVVFCILSTGALNPDGVSYLDLAAAAGRGDWSHFVQGYWSPLLPLITGAIGTVARRSGPQLIPVTHIFNLVMALAALGIIWHWARHQPSRLFGRFAIAGFMLCSAGLPRIEAVTPDVLLLTLTIWLSYELLVHRGRRWLLVGLLLGLAYLTKTSAWPWLLVAIPVRLWAARDGAARRRVSWSFLVAAAVMLTWVVPLSFKYGHPTLGSAGRLNYSWYIKSNSSRLPDTDSGTNSAYQSVAVGGGHHVTLVTFDDTTAWTYQPWDDPTEWATRVLTETGRAPTAAQLLTYWWRLALRIFGLWLAPLIAAVMLPAWVLLRRPGMRHELLGTERDALAVMVLGAVGVAQFAAVHAEPRLIAPYGAMLALGLLQWCAAAPSQAPAIRSRLLHCLLAWIGVGTAFGFTVFRINEGLGSYRRLRGVAAQLDELRARLISAGQPSVPLAVVGPAAPVLASAFWIGARIVMQVPPDYADQIATLPADQQSQLLLTLFRGKVPLIWVTQANGGMRMLIVPPAQ